MPLIFVVDTGRSLLWNLLVFNVFCVLRGSFRNVEFSFLRWDKNQTKIIFRVKEQQLRPERRERCAHATPCSTEALQQPWTSLNNLQKQMCHQQIPKCKMGPDKLI